MPARKPRVGTIWYMDKAPLNMSTSSWWLVLGPTEDDQMMMVLLWEVDSATFATAPVATRYFDGKVLSLGLDLNV